MKILKALFALITAIRSSWKDMILLLNA